MMSSGGATNWGGIGGTLSNQTDLQSALNLKLSLAGVLPLAGFSSITGSLPDANLSANVQLKNGTLALSSFGSVTGSLADARLSSNVQLANGTLALNGFGSITGTLPAARVGDLSATYLTVAAAASSYQPLDADLTSWAAVTRASGFDTFTATPSSANLASLVTGETGTGALVFANSPALITPDLGTPSALVLTNATGLSGSAVSGGTFGAVNGSALTALNASNISTGTLAAARVGDLSATYLTPAAAAAAYQPLDADLTAIAALTGTNTIYYRSGAATWTPVTVGTGLTFSGGTLSGSTGTGSVTSVAMTVPSIFSLSGSPITTSGTLAVSLASQSANTIFAGPTTGSAATPAFRALVAADIPSLSSVYQPLDADLTAIAALTGTNTIYYRAGTSSWAPVTIGDGLGFSGGTIEATSGVDTNATLTADRLWTFGQFGLWMQSTEPVAEPFIFEVTANTGSVDLFHIRNPGGTVVRVPSDGGLVANYFTSLADVSGTSLTARGSSSGSVILASPATGNSGTITIGSTTNQFSFTNGTASLTVPAGVSGTLNSIAFVTPGTGINTFLATPSGANLASALTTALPASKGGTGLTSLGTGIATALGVNTGSAGAPVLFNGALGTPSSGTISGSFVTGGTFGAVNGSALTALNASNISSGSLSDSRLSANVQLANGTLALGGFGSITGTLAAARIADLSATYLTVAAAAAGYQPLDADLTAIAALSGTNNIYYRSGAGAWSSVTIGTGLAFSGGSLTTEINGATGTTDNVILRADGTGAKTVQGGGVLTLSDTGALGFPDGVSQVFNPNGTNSGLNVGAVAGDPSSPSNGDLWYDSTANELTARINGASVVLGVGSFAVGTTPVTSGTVGRLFFEGAGNVISQDSDLSFSTDTLTATKLNCNQVAITSGSNMKAGTFALASGAATVLNTSVTANSVIIVTVKTVSGTRAGNPDIVPTAATGFTATGGGSDNSTYNYVILEVN